MDLADKVRDIPDFPVEGILFKDITPLLADADAYRHAVDGLAERVAGQPIDKVVAIESRGFIFGAALAYKLGVGFVPVRKPDKLPAQKTRVEYSLEYGSDALEMHIDGIVRGERVLVVDDLLATGGSAQATIELVERVGGRVVAVAFLIELTFLKGVERLQGYDVYSLIQY